MSSSINKLLDEISNNISYSFNELMKLVLKKAIKPRILFGRQNTKNVYNRILRRYESVPKFENPDGNVGRYDYSLTKESLGWVNDFFTNFKTTPKVARSLDGFKKMTTNTFPILFSDKEEVTLKTPNFYYEVANSRNIQAVVASGSSKNSYTTNLPYTFSFKFLENIGEDIINETDPQLTANQSVALPTAKLRAMLFNLDDQLGSFSESQPDLFADYIQMVTSVNSIVNTDVKWLVSLIALLRETPWCKVACEDQQTYIDILGPRFINQFVNNSLVLTLLKEDYELIFKSSYLFSLLKMLFSVFGFSKLVPTVVYDELTPEETINPAMKGAYIRRGECKLADEIVDRTKPNDLPELNREEIKEYISQFGELYPILIGLMGGTENIMDNLEINADRITPNYNGLDDIPQFLWRFNDYSYVQFVDFLNDRQVCYRLGFRIDRNTIELNKL